ncbi:MAG: hypothetical protein A2Y89_07080 [Chloroflexi bacterium RBG_13_51_18]|nr:MAG: hypothetical protein A2Y89_07080 [Chloroflexi bacterium RBG_13_51_18]
MKLGSSTEAAITIEVLNFKRKQVKKDTEMDWQIIVAIAIAIPVILFPAAYVWYINLGGIFAAVKEARAKNQALQKEA